MVSDAARVLAAETPEERAAIEATLLVQTDNRPHDLDPVQPEEEHANG